MLAVLFVLLPSALFLTCALLVCVFLCAVGVHNKYRASTGCAHIVYRVVGVN